MSDNESMTASTDMPVMRLADKRGPGQEMIYGFEASPLSVSPFEVWETMFGPNPDADLQIWRRLPEPRLNKKGKLVDMGCVISDRLPNLRTVFPQLLDLVFIDSFFTVNLFYSGAKHWKDPETGFRVMRRLQNLVHYLVNCYVDCDVGRDPADAKDPLQTLDFWDAMGIAGKLMREGVVPYSTWFVETGRGAAAIWTLRDDTDRDKLVKLPAYFGPEREERERIIGLYKRINKELAYRLRDAAADKIHDASRYLRTPFSRHSKTNRAVIWHKQMPGGVTPFYTLPELARWAGIELNPAPLPYRIRTESLCLPPGPQTAERRTQKPKSVPNRRKGQQRIGELRVHDIMLLEGYHWGFPQKKRRRSILRYIDALRISGVCDREALEKAEAMARRCRPAYPSDANDIPVDDLVRDAYKVKRSYKTSNLVHWFGVDDELAGILGLVHIIPPETARARKADHPTRGQVREKRLEAIKDYIRQNAGIIPPLRVLARVVRAVGCPTCYTTIRNDLGKLGLEIPHAGRPKMLKNTLLPLTD